MQTKEITFRKFDGGKAFDVRDAQSNQFSKSLNFDIHAQGSVLTPVRAYEADETYNGSSTGIKASDLTAFGNTGGTIFGLGRKNDGTGRKIYNKSITGDTWDAFTDSLGGPVEAADGSPYPGFFMRNFTSNGLSQYWFVTSSGTTATNGLLQLGFIDYSQGVVENFSKKTLAFNPTFTLQGILGKDGKIYISDNNKVHSCNLDGTVSSNVFTVSVNYKITSFALYGNYLAIAIYGQGRSKLLLWDYANAQATETIEWGEGALMVIENLDNVLVGVTDKFISSTLFPGSANGTGLMQIKEWSGGFGRSTDVKAYGTVDGAVQQYKYIKNGCLLWYAKIPLENGEYEEGIWSYGKRVSSQTNALSLQRGIAGSSFEGFWGADGYLYLPHSGDGSVSRTASTDIFTLTSTYETVIINDEDSAREKQALGATLSFEPLDSGQTIGLKYRKDGGAWTTLDPVPALATNDLSAVFLPSFNFREIEFQVTSTGGAKPTTLKFIYEPLNNAIQ